MKTERSFSCTIYPNKMDALILNHIEWFGMNGSVEPCIARMILDDLK